jgi:hypothetical protein
VILFGIGDIIGTEADPAMLEGVTGLATEEIQEQSPEAARFIGPTRLGRYGKKTRPKPALDTAPFLQG